MIFPAHSKDWKKFEWNNKTIALNVLYAPYNPKQETNNDDNDDDDDDDDENEYDGTKYIRPAYISKHNNKRDTQVNLLMIADAYNNWHYLAVTRISGLLRGITSRHNGDFYCLNCFHSYTTENKLKKHEKICNEHDFCFLRLPEDDKNFFCYVLGKKPLKFPFIIYADLECILKKMNTSSNNPTKSYTEKKAKHIASGCPLVTCAKIMSKNIIEVDTVWECFVMI